MEINSTYQPEYESLKKLLTDKKIKY